MIWAQSLARPGQPPIIGRDGGLPWRLPEDLAHFRSVTSGGPVIMGRATWESLPPRFRPLPERDNIVLTRRSGWAPEGAQPMGSVEQALARVAGSFAWVIGGGQVYAELLTRADRLEATEIDIDLGPSQPDDVGAPMLDRHWLRADGPWLESQSGLRYRFVSYRR
jgi:dihydrofolate reductase